MLYYMDLIVCPIIVEDATCWRPIWKLNVSFRISFFIWEVMGGKKLISII